ncbi:hypothetical protein HDU76_011896 [Blyttiomyces sp. JEL0837]|nr:hypothetical protein HDU76_011896 [Blyttiomyces sp. JEL0837]
MNLIQTLTLATTLSFMATATNAAPNFPVPVDGETLCGPMQALMGTMSVEIRGPTPHSPSLLLWGEGEKPKAPASNLKAHRVKSFAEEMPSMEGHNPKMVAAIKSFIAANPAAAANLYYGISDCKNAPVKYNDNYKLVKSSVYQNLGLLFAPTTGAKAPVSFTSTGVSITPNIPAGFYQNSDTITYQHYNETATWTTGTSSFASHSTSLLAYSQPITPVGTKYFTSMPPLTVDFNNVPLTNNDDVGFTSYLDSTLTSTSVATAPVVTVAGTADVGVTFVDHTTNPTPISLCIFGAQFSTTFQIQGLSKLSNSAIQGPSTYVSSVAGKGVTVNTLVSLDVPAGGPNVTSFNNIGATTFSLYNADGTTQVGTVAFNNLNLPTGAVAAAVTLNPIDPTVANSLTFGSAFFNSNGPVPVKIGKAVTTNVGDLATALSEISFTSNLASIPVKTLFQDTSFKGVIDITQSTINNPQVLTVSFTNNFVTDMNINSIVGSITSSPLKAGDAPLVIGTLTTSSLATTGVPVAKGAVQQASVTFTPNANFAAWYNAISDYSTKKFPTTYTLSISGTVTATIGSTVAASGASISFSYLQDKIPTKYVTFNNSLCGTTPYDYKVNNCADPKLQVLCDLKVPSCGLACYDAAVNICKQGLYLCPIDLPDVCTNPVLGLTTYTCYNKVADAGKKKCINGVLEDYTITSFYTSYTSVSSSTSTFPVTTTISTTTVTTSTTYTTSTVNYISTTITPSTVLTITSTTTIDPAGPKPTTSTSTYTTTSDVPPPQITSIPTTVPTTVKTTTVFTSFVRSTSTTTSTTSKEIPTSSLTTTTIYKTDTEVSSTTSASTIPSPYPARKRAVLLF